MPQPSEREVGLERLLTRLQTTIAAAMPVSCPVCSRAIAVISGLGGVTVTGSCEHAQRDDVHMAAIAQHQERQRLAMLLAKELAYIPRGEQGRPALKLQYRAPLSVDGIDAWLTWNEGEATVGITAPGGRLLLQIHVKQLEPLRAGIMELLDIIEQRFPELLQTRDSQGADEDDETSDAWDGLEAALR